jgi:hypothetical protein
LTGPATLAGIPLPETMVETLRAQARVEPVLVDADRTPLRVGRARTTLSAKVIELVLARAGHRCQLDCQRRHGLQIHHMIPVSWGGSDDPSNLVAVCVGGPQDHHAQLVPHGPWMLVGDPNQPDGLHLIHQDDWLRDHPEFRPRAGPQAA